MKLEKIKREFIRYMEEVHGGDPYPRNFYGCLLSIINEPEPVSQERIIELTGYSQATVSLTIQKIQLLMPVRKIRKPGDRKLYYQYDDPNRFILDITQRRVDIQDLDTKSVEPILEIVDGKVRQDSVYKRFQLYLRNLLLYLNLIHKLRTESAAKFENALKKGSLDGINLQDLSILESGKLADFIVQLREASKQNGTVSPNEDPRPQEYLSLKHEYFSQIKSNLNPLYSQTLANNFIIIHDIIIEGCTTQEKIERSTLLPRSTISEVLTNVVDRGVLKVTKQKGSRIKYYELAIPFSDLMLSYFDRAANYILTVRNRLSEFAEEVRKLRSESIESKKFLGFLENLERAYSFSFAFSLNMKVNIIKRLKDEYDSGFVFI
jgi:DNA-binding transcriptional regulator GbsR (MarR family)